MAKFGFLFFGRGLHILNDGVRGSQSFFKTAYLSRFSDFASLKNLSEFYFCFVYEIRMRNCEPYTRCVKNSKSALLFELPLNNNLSTNGTGFTSVLSYSLM